MIAEGPPVPDELVRKREDWQVFQFCSEPERDCEGNSIDHYFKDERGEWCVRPSRHILRSYRLRDRHFDGRIVLGRRVNKLIKVAQAFEDEQRNAMERSNLIEVRACFDEAKHAVEIMCSDAADLEPKNMAEVFIQARAIGAFAETENPDGFMRYARVLANGLRMISGEVQS